MKKLLNTLSRENGGQEDMDQIQQYIKSPRKNATATTTTSSNQQQQQDQLPSPRSYRELIRHSQVLEKQLNAALKDKERLAKQVDVFRLLSSSIIENHHLHNDCSFIYHTQHVLDFHHFIHEHPFYDLGRKSMWRTIDELKQQKLDLEREVILVDLKNDIKLQALVNTVNLLLIEKSVKECYRIIALQVHEELGLFEYEVEDIIEQTKRLKFLNNSNVVKLGDITLGISCHRAILFKLLCDALSTSDRQLPCRLVRGYKRSAHEWNVVSDSETDQYYVVDVMQAPGKLLEEGSPPCEDYKRNGGEGIGGTSVMQEFKPSVSINDFERDQQCLGRGSHGKVYAVRYRKEKEFKYVMKIVKFSRENTKFIAMKEVNLMKYLNHENLMTIKHCFVHEEKLVMIMDRMAMTGYDLIHSEVLYDNVQLVCYLLLVARGIRFLHRNSLIHRDIKPLNILVNLSNQNFENGDVPRAVKDVRVADFGLSKFVLEEKMHQTLGVGTLCYMAPEIRLSSIYDNKVDSYSFGVMLAETATRKSPSRSTYTRDLFEATGKEFLYDLHCHCTAQNSADRPTFDEITRELEILLVYANSKA